MDPRQPLSGYKPPLIWIDCPRCRRHGAMRIADLKRRFGDNLTLADLARRVAADGGCALAAGPEPAQCSAFPIQPPVTQWAKLDHARHGGWSATLYCCRRLESLKRGRSCPEAVDLDVLTLIATLGGDMTLDRLPSRCACPRCGTSVIEIEWHVPDETTPPTPQAAGAPVLRLRPARVEMGRKRLRVVDGG